MSKKLIILNTHPIQYFAPLYQKMQVEGIDLEVWYIRNPEDFGSIDPGFGRQVVWDIPLLANYRSKFLSKKNRIWDLILSISQIKQPAELVVYGWGNSYYLIALIVAKLFSHKTGFRTEHPDLAEERKKVWSKAFRRIFFKCFLFRFIDHFYFIGTRNFNFYRNLGVLPKSLYFTPYSIDIERLSMHQAEDISDGKFQIRKKFGIPDLHKVILFTGKLSAVKRVFDLLHAFVKINYSDVSLILVGDGYLRPEIENWIEYGNHQNIYLAGFINQSEILKYYAEASILVLCSESETWGLSINEAMTFGVPCIVSNTVGCASDLIVEGQTGFVFPMGNVEKLKECLDNYFKLSVEGQLDMGRNARQLISRFSYAEVIRGFRNGLGD